MKKLRVLLLAGGRSEEHEVSITSANAMLEACKGTDLEVTPLVVTHEGRWLSPSDSRKALTDGKAYSGGELALESAKVASHYDVVFPLIHGPNGEDGTVQGMLELAGLPYVGSGVLASALCMDKAMSKEVLRANGIPVAAYRLVTRHSWQKDKEECLKLCAELKGPWFVKPANLGSSVGITKVKQPQALEAAIELALRYDRRILIEESVSMARELEVAILGNDAPKASPVGEITYDSEFYDYATKYTDGMANLHIPADIPESVAKKIQELGLKAYQLSDCCGFARIDFFYSSQSGDIVLSEINTIPGFTPYSMFPKLWEAGGINYGQLIQMLAEFALERHVAKR